VQSRHGFGEGSGRLAADRVEAPAHAVAGAARPAAGVASGARR
jgi:hypothetical protein